MTARLKINDKEFKKALKSATAEGLQRATVFYHTRAKLALNVPNTRKTTRKRDTRGKFVKGTSIYPSSSKPGEPPRKRTGFGQRNVVMEFDRAIPAGRVGIRKNAIYMLFLELGTRFIARRPWLVKTLMDNKAILGRLMAVGGKRKIK